VKPLASTATEGEFRTETWEALGTTAVLRTCGTGVGAVRAAVQREVDAIDAAASRFRSDSELSRLNAARGSRLVVSRLFLEAVRAAIDAAAISGGAVDPTLGVSLVQAAAKALAADRAAKAAHLAGEVGVLVALGGDIATCGRAPNEGWRVHVTDDHRAGPEAPGQTISIESGGLATSSITARRWVHGKRTMHHILDPHDGEPVQAWWRTASVTAATCLDANIAATAAIVLGRRAQRWLAEQALPARLVALDGTVEAQGGWPE
jgi:FAD:protein FMN transferase